MTDPPKDRQAIASIFSSRSASQLSLTVLSFHSNLSFLARNKQQVSSSAFGAHLLYVSALMPRNSSVVLSFLSSSATPCFIPHVQYIPRSCYDALGFQAIQSVNSFPVTGLSLYTLAVLE